MSDRHDLPYHLPPRGEPRSELFRKMRDARQHDVRWREGRVFSLVFYAGEDVYEVAKEAYGMFFSENALNPTAFPSLRKFESEVVAMTAGLLGGDGNVAGNMTSGGTESLLMTMLTAREWARSHRPDILLPEVVLPSSAHPAFDKAAHYFGLKLVRTPVRSDFRADVDAMAQAITSNTVMLVGSAPSYPQGVVDPIAEIAALAQAHDLLCHVDACVGGMMLPFVERLGYPVPPWDFRVPGVTSISVDLHKYGYTPKGASVILYRHKALRRHQLFATIDWSGGIYASPTMAGTRPGGVIAAAWAVMHYLGEDGYKRIANEVMKTRDAIQKGVEAIPGLKILSDPDMSVLAIASDDLDIYLVADEMSVRGWQLDRQQLPPSLHLTLHYGHRDVVDDFLRDLAASVEAVRRPSPRRLFYTLLMTVTRFLAMILPERWLRWLTQQASHFLGGGDGLPQRSAPMYGMMGTLPNRGDVKELVLDLVESFTDPKQANGRAVRADTDEKPLRPAGS